MSDNLTLRDALAQITDASYGVQPFDYEFVAKRFIDQGIPKLWKHFLFSAVSSLSTPLYDGVVLVGSKKSGKTFYYNLLLSYLEEGYAPSIKHLALNKSVCDSIVEKNLISTQDDVKMLVDTLNKKFAQHYLRHKSKSIGSLVVFVPNIDLAEVIQVESNFHVVTEMPSHMYDDLMNDSELLSHWSSWHISDASAHRISVDEYYDVFDNDDVIKQVGEQANIDAFLSGNPELGIDTKNLLYGGFMGLIGALVSDGSTIEVVENVGESLIGLSLGAMVDLAVDIAMRAAAEENYRIFVDGDSQERFIELFKEVALRVVAERTRLDAVGAQELTHFLDENIGPGAKKTKKTIEVNITDLNRKLSSEVYGQDKAISTLIDSLTISFMGLKDENKPRGVFLFAGKSGTGKTQMARTLSTALFGEGSIIRVDMSEYSKDHEYSKLIGSPPGYQGSDNGGFLTNSVMKNPSSVILLDEVEKAHPKIWDSFLQVFDAGRMTDGKGKVVDFKDTIIIMTTNLGAQELSKRSCGFGEQSSVDNRDSTVMKVLESNFRPELLNRIDEVLIFNDITQDIARSIIEKEFHLMESRLEKHHISSLKVSPSVYDKILSESNIDKYGAREIQRVVSRSVAIPVAHKLLRKRSSEPVVDVSLSSSGKVQVNFSNKVNERKSK